MVDKLVRCGRVRLPRPEILGERQLRKLYESQRYCEQSQGDRNPEVRTVDS